MQKGKEIENMLEEFELFLKSLGLDDKSIIFTVVERASMGKNYFHEDLQCEIDDYKLNCLTAPKL